MYNNNNSNNNNKVYTPLTERCSQSRVFISQCHMNHIDNTVWIIWNGSCSTESHSNISKTNKWWKYNAHACLHYLLYKDTNIRVKYEDTVTVYGAYYTWAVEAQLRSYSSGIQKLWNYKIS